MTALERSMRVLLTLAAVGCVVVAILSVEFRRKCADMPPRGQHPPTGR